MDANLQRINQSAVVSGYLYIYVIVPGRNQRGVSECVIVTLSEN